MLKHGYLDGALCLISFVGMVMVLCTRMRGDGKGIGVRVIQMVSVIVILPIVAILGIEGVLSGEGTGTLLGSIVGYALGGVADPVPKKSEDSPSTKSN